MRNVIKLNLWAHIKSTHPILNGVGTFSTGAGHRFYMMQLFISYSSKSSVHLFDKLEIVTPQGKRHLRKLEAEKKQLTLDLFG